MSRSKSEEKIASILRGAGISFTQEYTIGAQGFRGYKLPYDFHGVYNGKEFLIEFQGAEHYEFIPYFHKNRSDFLQRQVYDERKIKAALTANIPLYCIPYWDLDRITSIDDLLNPIYIATSKNHNYNAWRAHKENE